MDKMINAMDSILKHYKDNEEELAISDLAKYVTALLRFNTFLFPAIDKLIMLQEKGSNSDRTTTRHSRDDQTIQ